MAGILAVAEEIDRLEREKAELKDKIQRLEIAIDSMAEWFVEELDLNCAQCPVTGCTGGDEDNCKKKIIKYYFKHAGLDCIGEITRQESNL